MVGSWSERVAKVFRYKKLNKNQTTHDPPSDIHGKWKGCFCQSLSRRLVPWLELLLPQVGFLLGSLALLESTHLCSLCFLRSEECLSFTALTSSQELSERGNFDFSGEHLKAWGLNSGSSSCFPRRDLDLLWLWEAWIAVLMAPPGGRSRKRVMVGRSPWRMMPALWFCL